MENKTFSEGEQKSLNEFSFLVNGVQTMAANSKMLAMWVTGTLLIWLAIGKDFEPALLLPMGSGAVLINLPLPNVLGSIVVDAADHTTVEGVPGIVTWLFQTGIETSEAFPFLLFVDISAMVDFEPLLSNPRILLFGGAARLGIFLTVVLAVLLGFPLKDTMSIGVIGAADGPTSILVSQTLGSAYMGAIAVTVYSYMILVSVIQPLAIKLIASRKEYMIRMPYNPKSVTRTTKTLFPIIITLIAGMIAPGPIVLVGFLMFGNLVRESDCLESLSQIAQGPLVSLAMILLGIIIVLTMQAGRFLNVGTLIVMALGLFAFMFDTVGRVLFTKILNIFLPQDKKTNPMVDGVGISAFPMPSHVIQKMASKEDNQSHLLMHAVDANIAGQIGSVVTDGIILSLTKVLLAQEGTFIMSLTTLVVASQSIIGEVTAENIERPLKLMSKGMLGIFIVVILIYVLIVDLDRLTGGKGEKQ